TERADVRQRRSRGDGVARAHLGRDEAARLAAVELLAGLAVGEHLVTLRVAGRDDGGEAAELAAEDGGGPERVVRDDPSLDAEERLADRRIAHRQHGARAERVGLLAERVDLVGTREPSDGAEALGPRGVVPARRGPELQHELRAARRHASTGVPAAAEA